MPGPCDEMYRNAKQKTIASSPPFSIGYSALLPCAIQYAAAIKPLQTNAAQRVISPIITIAPPMSSMGPATYVMNAGIPSVGGAGHPNSFCEP